MEKINAAAGRVSGWLRENMLPERESRTSGGRILYLDSVKLLAAFLTVFYHFAYYRLDYGFTPGSAYIPNLERVVMCIAAACVPLFFLVNGSLVLSRERRWQSMLGKVVKILILLAVWSFAQFPSWFFKTLCILYVLTPLFQWAYRAHRWFYRLMCVGVFCMPFAYNLAVMVVNGLHLAALPRTGLFTMYSILYFLLGPVLTKRKAGSVWMAGLTTLAGLELVLGECVVYTNLDQVMFDGVNAAFPTVGALLLSVGLFELMRCVSWERVRGPLLFLSRQILPIYLLHLWVIRVIPVFPGTVSLLGGLAGSALVLLVCAVLGKIFARVLVLCWLVKM